MTNHFISSITHVKICFKENKKKVKGYLVLKVIYFLHFENTCVIKGLKLPGGYTLEFNYLRNILKKDGKEEEYHEIVFVFWPPPAIFLFLNLLI